MNRDRCSSLHVRQAPRVSVATLVTALLPLCATTGARAQDAAACAALRNFALPGVALEISSAEHVAAGPPPAGPGGRPADARNLPAHCRVDGLLERRTGVGGMEYAIRFALALPDSRSG